ncbi:MAG: HAD-IA family hydrolase [Lachnospiraceae bacterium]|nr:HAD-IA family hydrolase [Lachnospiraceae bacterium]
MKSNKAYIWDLDGTLLDSYDLIVSGLWATCREFNLRAEKEEIRKEVITYSVSSFIAKAVSGSGISAEDFRKRYAEINDGEKLNIRAVKNAKEILSFLRNRGERNFVFTHRGGSTDAILKNLGLKDFFEDVIRGTDGFPRKPDPAALEHLIKKHGLNKETTYYVGDRSLDMECAFNAGIKGIMYLPPNSFAKPTGNEDHIIGDLSDIKNLY